MIVLTTLVSVADQLEDLVGDEDRLVGDDDARAVLRHGGRRSILQIARQLDQAGEDAASGGGLRFLDREAAEARQRAADLEARGQKTEQERLALRIQLREQLNKILQTQDTARGLIVNMSDVLFDTAQYSLRPGAREKLAKMSGILLAHPELKLQVEGHTDSVGGDDYNQKLSENRANAVRTYLVSQGLDSGIVTAQGFGKTRPVADNSTAAGRQQNRRVEMVVAGDVLGTSASVGAPQ